MSTHNTELIIREQPDPDENRVTYEEPLRGSELNESKGLFEDNDEPELVLLKDTKHKNLFLAKVGLVFMVHYTMWVLVSLFVTFHDATARHYYWLYRLNVSTWVFLLYALSIRFIFTFASHYVKNMSKFFMLFDFYVTFQLSLGLYYYFTLFLKTQYIYHGHYVIMFSYVMFFNSLAFTLSCLIKDKRNVYNFYIGFAMLEVSTFATMYVSSYFFHIPTLTKVKYKFAFILMSVVNFYFASNAYLIVKHRGAKYYDYEHIRCFFCFWTDLLYCYWDDMTRGTRLRREKLRLEMRELRRQKKAEKKKAKELEEERERQQDLEDDLASIEEKAGALPIGVVDSRDGNDDRGHGAEARA